MYRLINASAHKTGLDNQSVHAVIFSPPYWNLRKYAGEQSVDWTEVTYHPMAGLPAITIPAMTCELGLEVTPEAYVGHMILVMREMWRVLRDDGTCWINLGDTFAGSSRGGQSAEKRSQNWRPEYPKSDVPRGLKPKDLCMIPSRFALAAQAEGWYLRGSIIWSKVNCLPESVTDRPTRSHENVYLFSKSPRYFYDNEAVKTPLRDSSIQRVTQPNFWNQTGGPKDYSGSSENNINRSMRRSLENFAVSNGFADIVHETLEIDESDQMILFDELSAYISESPDEIDDNHHSPRFGGNKADEVGSRLHSGNEWKPNAGANLRDVWRIPTGSYSGAHFATYPEDLVEPMILASTSARGVCPKCGAPWVRVIKKSGEYRTRWKEGAAVIEDQWGAVGATSVLKTNNVAIKETVGWEPTCQCQAGEAEAEPIPATILDPFNGSGTTGRVANRLGRNYIGVDIAKEYLDRLSPDRMANVQYEMQF